MARGAEENERVFDLLADQKEHIESEFGEALHWQRNEGSNPCRIYKLNDVPDWTDESGWNQLHEEIIDSMIRLDRA